MGLSPDRVKPEAMKLVFVASPLSGNKEFVFSDRGDNLCNIVHDFRKGR
jgi:hypothetical protein